MPAGPLSPEARHERFHFVTLKSTSWRSPPVSRRSRAIPSSVTFPARRKEVAAYPQDDVPRTLWTVFGTPHSCFPLIAFMTRLGESVGVTLSSRCTWSGPHAPSKISMSCDLQISRISPRGGVTSTPSRHQDTLHRHNHRSDDHASSPDARDACGVRFRPTQTQSPAIPPR